MLNKINSENEYDTALQQLQSLMNSAGPYGKATGLEELATALEAYEAERYPMPEPSLEAQFAFRVDQGGHRL